MTKFLVSRLILFLIIGASSLSQAASLCPPTGRGEDWSTHCFDKVAAGRQVRPEYRENIVLNAVGFAVILIGGTRELVAVDSEGIIRFPNIYHTGDFDYPTARYNLARFEATEKNDIDGTRLKCGYFDSRTFKIVIPPIYDHCRAFGEDTATVCTECQVYCIETECQNTTFVGGEGRKIDTTNTVLSIFSLPSFDEICGGAERVRVIKMLYGSNYLKCLGVHEIK